MMMIYYYILYITFKIFGIFSVKTFNIVMLKSGPALVI
jgi:hypothetical protein